MISSIIGLAFSELVSWTENWFRQSRNWFHELRIGFVNAGIGFAFRELVSSMQKLDSSFENSLLQCSNCFLESRIGFVNTEIGFVIWKFAVRGSGREEGRHVERLQGALNFEGVILIKPITKHYPIGTTTVTYDSKSSYTILSSTWTNQFLSSEDHFPELELLSTMTKPILRTRN